MLYIPIPFDDEVKQEILSAENPIEKMDELIPTEYIEGLRANTIYVYLNILLSEKSVSIDAKKLLSLYAERSQYVYGDCSAFIPITHLKGVIKDGCDTSQYTANVITRRL